EGLGHRLAFDQIFEPDGALDLGHDRPGIGIPFGDALAAFNLLTVLDLHAGAVLDAMQRPFGTVLIDDHNHHVARHRDQLAVGVALHRLIADPDRAVEVRFDERLLRDLRRTADVECTHGELRARLADRLSRDNTDSLAHVDGRAAREIAPVALAAHAVRELAGQHRPDAQLLNARIDDLFDLLLLEQRAAFHDDPVGRWIAQILGSGAPENTARERCHHPARIDECPHLDPARPPALFARNYAVLPAVHPT